MLSTQVGLYCVRIWSEFTQIFQSVLIIARKDNIEAASRLLWLSYEQLALQRQIRQSCRCHPCEIREVRIHCQGCRWSCRIACFHNTIHALKPTNLAIHAETRNLKIVQSAVPEVHSTLHIRLQTQWYQIIWFDWILTWKNKTEFDHLTLRRSHTSTTDDFEIVGITG